MSDYEKRMETHAKRRQLRTQRSNSGFAATFFAGAAFVFFLLTGSTAWLGGHDFMWLWWIFFTVFVVCVVCAGAASYNYWDASDDLKELNRR